MWAKALVPALSYLIFIFMRVIILKEAKLVKIGNSQGIRLPKTMTLKYGFGEFVVLEEVRDGILIHAPNRHKLSWEKTYKETAQTEKDEWSDWQNMESDSEKHL